MTSHGTQCLCRRSSESKHDLLPHRKHYVILERAQKRIHKSVLLEYGFVTGETLCRSIANIFQRSLERPRNCSKCQILFGRQANTRASLTGHYSRSVVCCQCDSNNRARQLQDGVNSDRQSGQNLVLLFQKMIDEGKEYLFQQCNCL